MINNLEIHTFENFKKKTRALKIWKIQNFEQLIYI